EKPGKISSRPNSYPAVPVHPSFKSNQKITVRSASPTLTPPTYDQYHFSCRSCLFWKISDEQITAPPLSHSSLAFIRDCRICVARRCAGHGTREIPPAQRAAQRPGPRGSPSAHSSSHRSPG